MDQDRHLARRVGDAGPPAWAKKRLYALGNAEAVRHVLDAYLRGEVAPHEEIMLLTLASVLLDDTARLVSEAAVEQADEHS